MGYCVIEFELILVFYGMICRFDDPEVQKVMKLVPYKIVNKDGKPYIEVKVKDGEVKVFSPEEISAMILGKTKETAEAYLGEKVKDAVVTVPGRIDPSLCIVYHKILTMTLSVLIFVYLV